MVKKIVYSVLLIGGASWLVFAQGDARTQSINRGKEVYQSNCMNCHQESGAGLEGLYPPLAKADYLLKQPKKTINIILEGQQGEITVNGKKYNVLMPAQNYLSDEQIADVTNYVSNTWGNKVKTTFTPAQVKAERK